MGCGPVGLEVDIVWDTGTLRQSGIRSLRGGPCLIRLGEETLRLDTQPGVEYVLDGALRPL